MGEYPYISSLAEPWYMYTDIIHDYIQEDEWAGMLDVLLSVPCLTWSVVA